MDNRYEEALEKAEEIFPQLKESEDEKIRKWLIEGLRKSLISSINNGFDIDMGKMALAWLEKQDKKYAIKAKAHQIAWETSKHYDPSLSKESWCEMAALDMASWFEKQGQTFTKKDVDDAYLKGVCDTKHELEKQGVLKEYTFKSLPRLLDMIEPTSRAKAYCQKLIDTLVKEGYPTDAKIVEECLKKMNDEDVPMAIMDEKQGKHLENYDKDMLGAIEYCKKNNRPLEEEHIDWLERKGEKDKKEINNFEVIPGLYKCVHRMFDGTPDGKLLFEIGNVYKCLSKHDRAEFEVSYGHSVYLEDPVICKHFIPFENQGEQNPYSGVSFEYNGHAWGMCARDGGVEIAIDSELKAFVSLDKSFVYPNRPKKFLYLNLYMKQSKKKRLIMLIKLNQSLRSVIGL